MINSVTTLDGKLKYNYDGKALSIDLGMNYPVEKCRRQNSYVAKPDEVPTSGSAAISSD